MKIESQKRQQEVLFLATENVILHINQPFTIRQDMIESKNFIPEAFLMHQFHDSKDFQMTPLSSRLSEGLAQGLFPGVAGSQDSPFQFVQNEISYFSDDEDDEDVDEDEDWDEDEDEDWDEDEDEDWDEEDEDWDEDDEDWEDEDEDWSDDEDE